jgi:chromatin segregation and condensation protein Rec8/ScpA/Scc1 (kleisin family)
MLAHQPVVYLSQLLKKTDGRMEIVATVLAGLELSKVSQVRLKQDDLFGEVEIVRINHN